MMPFQKKLTEKLKKIKKIFNNINNLIF
jgi:hypothetical protein